MTALLVLHDFGAEAGGAPWRAAFAAAGWPGPVHAPDLPGHAGTPPPVGGNYELADAAFAVLPLVRDLSATEAEPPVIVGVGANGWAAQLLAVGGRASSLVLVDGIGGPWLDAVSTIAAGRDLLRAVANDAAALAPPHPGGTDPRLVHHSTMRPSSRAMAERVLRALSVPLLVIETPASPLGAADRDDLLAQCGMPVTTVELAEVNHAAVAQALLSVRSGV